MVILKKPPIGRLFVIGEVHVLFSVNTLVDSAADAENNIALRLFSIYVFFSDVHSDLGQDQPAALIGVAPAP
jgi:hypothetical protein